MRINNQYLGAKTEASKKDFKKWMVDGRFLPLDSQPHKYIYHHSRHANCSSVKFSQLYDLWCIKRIYMIKLLKKYLIIPMTLYSRFFRTMIIFGCT